MTKGTFLSLYLPYKDEKGQLITAEDQALAILQKAGDLIEAGAPGVAITYSANYNQTKTIRATYKKGEWKTGTSGANQASVMHHMEQLMDDQYAHLQEKLRIAPITTMTYSDFGSLTHLEVVEIDLQKIKNLLKEGWTILGWINQDSKPEYAIGGGVAQLTDQLRNNIQKMLESFATQYGPA